MSKTTKKKSSVKVTKHMTATERKERINKIFLFIIFTIPYAFFIGILYGTASIYLGVTPIFFGLYISWEAAVIIIGVGGWSIVTFIIFKKPLGI